jgi:hypothetical protein
MRYRENESRRWRWRFDVDSFDDRFDDRFDGRRWRDRRRWRWQCCFNRSCDLIGAKSRRWRGNGALRWHDRRRRLLQPCSKQDSRRGADNYQSADGTLMVNDSIRHFAGSFTEV